MIYKTVEIKLEVDIEKLRAEFAAVLEEYTKLAEKFCNDFKENSFPVAEAPTTEVSIFKSTGFTVGQEYFVPNLSNFEDSVERYTFNCDEIGEKYANRGLSFKTEEHAEAVSDALRVLLELRRQPGANESGEDGEAFTAILSSSDGLITGRVTAESHMAGPGLVPIFPSLKKTDAAIRRVGVRRIVKMMKLLTS